jgi:putative toxin-antitoxin system antitoxin component (TIGR02293 family)
MTTKHKEYASALKVLFMKDWTEMSHRSLGDCWVVLMQSDNPQERWLATYANLVGDRRLFNTMPSANIQFIIDGLDRGLPTQTLDKVTELMGLNRQSMSQVLDVSQRTLSRRHTLETATSERLFRVVALFQKALQVLGERDEARRWFTTAKKALGGKTPLEFSETEVGAREVEDLLGRIEYGVYA